MINSIKGFSNVKRADIDRRNIVGKVIYSGSQTQNGVQCDQVTWTIEWAHC